MNLEIAVLQHELAIATTETADVVLPAPFILEVLAFDAIVATTAETPVQLVVMALTVRSVLMDVKGCGGEGLVAVEAYKAGLVVASCQTAICAGNGFARDGQIAAFAVATR